MEVVREGAAHNSIVLRSNVLMEAEQRVLVSWLWKHRTIIVMEVVCEGCPEICK